MEINISWDWNTAILYVLILLVSMLLVAPIVLSKNNKNQLMNGNKNQNKKNRLMLIGLFWIFVLTIRSSKCGTDIVRYFSTYIQNNNENVWMVFRDALTREPLYGSIESILKMLNVNVYNKNGVMIYLGIFACLWVFFVMCAIQEEGEVNGYFIAVGIAFSMFFFRSFSMLRQSISMAIMLYAFTKLAKGEKKKYWFYQIIAIGFHYTAFVVIAAYFFWPDNIKKKNLKQLLVRFIVVMGIITFVIYGGDLLNSIFADTDSKYESFASRASTWGVGQLIIRMPLITILMCFRKDLIRQNAHNDGYLSLIILDVFIAQLNYVSPSFSRVSMYFANLYIFLMPSMYVVIRTKFGIQVARILAVVLIFGLFIYKLHYYTYTNPYGIMPFIIGEG